MARRRDRLRVDAAARAAAPRDPRERHGARGGRGIRPRGLARYDGCRTAKVKVAEPGQRLADDIARVRAVREAMGAEGAIRIDANGGWNVDEAEHAVHALAEFDLEYVEQPCASGRGARRAAPPGEVHRHPDRRRRERAQGRRSARRRPRRAPPTSSSSRRSRSAACAARSRSSREAGLPAVVSSALDTSVGLAMGVALAAALPDLDYDCGLGTAALFTADVAGAAARAARRVLPVGRVTPDAESSPRAPRRRSGAQWWLARLERCHALLSAPAAR